jgi:hypothetical protein
MGEPCNEPLAKRCGGAAGQETLVCMDGSWRATGSCVAATRCDTTLGPTHGSCQPTIQLCAGKSAGDAVCDGWARKRCGPDLLRLEPFDCPMSAHCTTIPSVGCACDLHYKDDGAGACVPDITCPANACTPGGKCIPGATDYSCECAVEYEGTGTQMCTLTGPCIEARICSPEYVCRSREGSFVCRGQFADWPVPSRGPGAKAPPSYASTADTVSDAVTALTWQRNVPDIYAGCDAGGCNWEDAKTYCDTLMLEGSGWRVPTLIELISLLDDERVMPSIDPEAFPDAPAAVFWSSSSSATVKTQAWTVSFAVFQAAVASKANSARVRCVR